jgi:hypothetical protein
MAMSTMAEMEQMIQVRGPQAEDGIMRRLPSVRKSVATGPAAKMVRMDVGEVEAWGVDAVGHAALVASL